MEPREYPATFEDVMTEAEFRGREQELTEAIDAWLQLLGADIAEPRFDF
ncbi:hypothetical protein HSBAA_30200 [Vreelandella sulfidaeris]|uniref:Uncharacterized protein n=1 Tax=Vreelandella sulfidaeris TaxID=115553 RepID=A0A455UF07_9GAMM|nr:hypothetical protein HSBAA_30200 [Halomonas sulfidaeris]